MKDRIITAVVFTALPILLLSACSSGGSNQAVSAATPEAAEAGMEILRKGGNAVDAAVAIAFALGVTEPAGSGLGGQSVLLIKMPEGRTFVINGTSFAPASTPTTILSYEEMTGRRGSTIPTTVKTLDYAWRKYGSGTVSWEELLAPAIRFADEGFIPGPFRRASLHYAADALRSDSASKINMLKADSGILPDGGLPADGSMPADGGMPEEQSVLRQPALAATLKRLARYGAEDFYRGGIAEAIARDMKSHGGWITLEDLRSLPDPLVQPALHSTYRGFDVFTLPPPYGGWAVLHMLKLLERHDAADLDDASGRLRIIAGILRIGHRSRRDLPVTDFLNYEQQVRKRISAEWAENQRVRMKQKTVRMKQETEGAGETTHYSVADAEGMIVSASQSVNYFFGCKVMHPELGFYYNDYMREFILGDEHSPYALKPGAMPYSSMSAAIVSRGDEVVMALGSPGSARIISTVVQVISAVIDRGVDLAGAVGAPRIHVIPDSALYLESAWDRSVHGPMLEKLGFVLAQPSAELVTDTLNPYFGGVHAVLHAGGEWTSAADPRRDGLSLTGN